MNIRAHPISCTLARSADIPGAVVLGGAHGSLDVVRSLGRRGIPVAFVTNDHPLPQYSRYALRSFTWAGPEHRDAASALQSLARAHGLERWLLIVGGDAELTLVAQHHEQLSATFRLTSPPWETARWAADKRLTYERAASLGIDAPSSYFPRGRDDILRLDCRFPVILKPTMREARNAFTLAKAWRADDRAALLAYYDAAEALVGAKAIVVQELIQGTGTAQYSYAAVWNRGQPVASLTARRARQFPIDFGYSSTLVETIVRPDVEQAAERFLRSLDYSGPVEIEFKYDAADGRTKILDVNARLWTWSALGAAAGVDFGHVLWRIARGEAVEAARGRPGVRWMHLSRDLVAASQEMMRGTLSVRDYLRTLGGPTTFAAFASDDPMPGLVELPMALTRAAIRRLPLLAGKRFKSKSAA
ncbi:MAG: ATP-grasp protein [Xanthobacteraceae bacterium]|nr:ATP-grasp protein [Xanthobacteraceae bacterium]